jgi:hypothetical protein
VTFLIRQPSDDPQSADTPALAALPDGLSPSVLGHPDVYSVSPRLSLQDRADGDDPACNDLVARVRDLVVDAKVGRLIVGEVNEPFVGGHADLIGVRPSLAVPRRGHR